MGEKDDHFEPAQAFWDYAVALYTSDGMESLFLTFQDEAGLDVNLLLLCCWTGRHGVRLDDTTLARLENHAGAWSEIVVHPLRSIRKRLKVDVGAMTAADVAEFRDRVKELELEAEKMEQQLLIRLLGSSYAKNGRNADRAGLVRANLVRYIRANSPETLTSHRTALEALIARSVALP